MLAQRTKAKDAYHTFDDVTDDEIRHRVGKSDGALTWVTQLGPHYTSTSATVAAANRTHTGTVLDATLLARQKAADAAKTHAQTMATERFDAATDRSAAGKTARQDAALATQAHDTAFETINRDERWLQWRVVETP